MLKKLTLTIALAATPMLLASSQPLTQAEKLMCMAKNAYDAAKAADAEFARLDDKLRLTRSRDEQNDILCQMVTVLMQANEARHAALMLVLQSLEAHAKAPRS